MLGPLGALGLVRTALTSFGNRRASRAPELSFASCEQVEALEDVFREFIPNMFGCAYDECFISDQSSLTDFTVDDDELANIQVRLRALYDIDVADLPDDRLVTIVRSIAESRVP